MKNPWLAIPASDYEGHMNDPQVAQLPFLAALFKKTVEHFSPHSLALLGCATGNGLEHVDTALTRRVTAVDINPEYCSICRRRYAQTIPGLEVICGDLRTLSLKKETYSLMYAALLFEYCDPDQSLPGIYDALEPGGILVSLLQLPSPTHNAITPTPYTSISLLSSIMRLIEPSTLRAVAEKCGFKKLSEEVITLPAGKSFYYCCCQKQ